MQKATTQSEILQGGMTIPEPQEIRQFAWQIGNLLAERTQDKQFLAFEAREGLTDFLTAILLIEAQKRTDAASIDALSKAS